MVHFYLSDATDNDFSFVYELKKIAYKEYIDKIWGWDDDFQIKFHRENFSSRNTKIINAGQQPIGSVDVKAEEKSIFISGLYILPQYQGKGIGTSIINGLIEMATKEKKRLELEVLRVNTRAQRLYTNLGFTLEEGDDTKFFMYR